MKGTTLLGYALSHYGYVHVTGLPVILNGEQSAKIVHAMGPTDLGRWDHNNGMAVVVTMNGEVWVGCLAGLCSMREDRQKAMKNAILGLCPNGQGTFVPFSNGETFIDRQFMARVANPSWVSDGSMGGRVVCQFDHLLVGG